MNNQSINWAIHPANRLSPSNPSSPMYHVDGGGATTVTTNSVEVASTPQRGPHLDYDNPNTCSVMGVILGVLMLVGFCFIGLLVTGRFER